MTHNQLEELENIRRMAERGRNWCAEREYDFVDVFQHIIDLVEQIKVQE